MAQKILNTKIREAYDTEANWMKHNPVLLAGQLAFSSDKYGKYKVGNGNSTWSQLQYATLSWGDILGKPSSFTPSSHFHTFDHITNLAQASVKYAVSAGSANAVAWNNVSGKPTSMQNPYALTISNFNNTKNVQYDGSSTQAVRLNVQLLYGASDSAIAMANENSSTNTRYVKLLDLTSHNSWQRTNQQFLIATRNLSFLLNIYVASTDTAKFSQYNISYIPLSSNIEIHRFLTGIVHVDNTKDRFELWYEQQQWASSVSVIPLGRSYEVNSGGYHFNGYITNSSSEGITTKPKFDIGIAIEKIMPVLYNGTGNAIDGAMTQQAVTIALETRALKEHSHTIANITNLQSTLDGKAPTTHEHNFLRVPDTRNENPAPNNAGFKKNSVAFDFRLSSKINSPTSNTFVGLMSFAPWSETSGGNGYQMAFGYLDEAHNTTPRLMLRTADLSATTWGAWHKIYTSGDKPTPAEIGAATSGHTHTQYALTSHTHNNYLPTSGGAVPNLNSIYSNATNTTIIHPSSTAIAASPFARFYWHDHFAFLSYHTILNHQVMLNGQSSWVNSYLDIKRLFCQKEYASSLELLEKNQLARRFTLKCSSFSYCGICWIEIGLCWTEVFSHFEVHIESSIDNAKWTTIHRSTFSHNQNGFLKIDDIAQANYLRFTFTKKTQLTTGTVSLNSIKGLTYRKGDQGLGIEYETPFDWDVNRNIYPHGNMSANLGTGSNKWKSVYAETFYGNLSGHATSANMLNANAGSSTQPVYFTGGKPVACTYTLGKSVPSNAVFTDTNTWRPIQDNLTSTSTTDSLSANQGRILKGLVDGKAPTSHTHNTINDFSSGKALSISNSIHTTPETAGDYDIVVTNTNNYGNKLITMTKVSLINQISDQVISNIPLKAITNSQIDSLANL